MTTQTTRRQALKDLSKVFVAGAASATGIGCGAEGFEDELEVDSTAQAVSAQYWRPFSTILANTAINTEPAIFSNQVGYTIAVRSSDQKFYLQRTTMSTNPAWTKFGDRQFASAPSASMQYPYPGTDNKFVIAGKGTDNLLYALEGQLPPAQVGQIPPVPVWTGPWAAISGTTYSSNASPAVAAGGNRVVVVFVSGSRVRAHYRSLPYASNSWNTTAVQSPTFPTGVSVSGVPAITYLGGSFNKFVVMVRGTSTSGAGLYWLYFNGTSFDTSWNQAFTAGINVDSDPSIEWDAQYNAFTLYLRSGNTVIQCSNQGPGGIGIKPWYAIPGTGNTLYGAPRAVFGAGIEGVRSVIIRGYRSSTPTNQRANSILYSLCNGVPDPFGP